MRPMSLFVISVAAAIGGSNALAGSLDDSILRGSADSAYGDDSAPRYVPGTPLRYRWEGLYLGGQIGYSSASIDFAKGASSMIQYILRQDVVGTHVADWTILSKGDTTKSNFGGFVGYNFQSDEIVYGLEGNYNFVNSKGLFFSSSDSITRTFADDTGAPAQHHFFYTPTVSASASARVTDYGTVRARAGVVLDRFLPYAFVGGAVGRVDVSRSATVSYLRQDIPDQVAPPATPITPIPDFNFGPQTRSEQKNGAFAYGYAAGLGMDVAVMPNVFMRAEWEYVQFAPIKSINISLNTLRAGLGIRF